MSESVWLDEAWVANSVLADSWSGMVQGETWVQSSPPLFLSIVRILAGIAGPAEWVLRIWPWIASALAVPFLFLALEAVFGRTSALMGATLVATNYWSIKMAQQVKQYSGDLLVSAIFAWALISLMTGRHQRPVVVWSLCCLAPWLSAPAIFWIVPALALLLYKDRSIARRAGLIGATGGSLALNYYFVLRPAMRSELTSSWAGDMLSSVDFGPSLRGFGENLGRLMLPPVAPALQFAAWLLVLVAILGALALAIRAFSSPERKQFAAAALAGSGPIVVSMAASLAGFYPLLSFPRVILWMLPSLAILSTGAIEPLVRRIETRSYARWGIVALCMAAVAAGQVVLLNSRVSTEQNRPAVQAMIAGVSAGDAIYVHGGVSEAFSYYARTFAWRPGRVFLGNSGWPCCPKNKSSRVSNPQLRDFELELQSASELARGRRLWVYAPSGVAGHWSAAIRPTLEKAPAVLSRAGCVEQSRQSYDQSMLLVFGC